MNDQQISIIKNINNNEDLKNLDSDTTIIITNNLYHKLGKLNHIEFLINLGLFDPYSNIMLKPRVLWL